MSDPIFFKSKPELKKWFAKNHKKLNEQWIGIYKKNLTESIYSAVDVHDLAFCYGWTAIIVKSIDYGSYKMLFRRRKENSSWSLKTIKRFNDLKKMKLIEPQGQWAFDQRDQSKTDKQKYELSKTHLNKFKKNKLAWSFFKKQTASYQKYTIQWVTSAIQASTLEKRFGELLKDSENQTKLLRILKSQNKIIESKKNKYPVGETPIEEAKNIGIITGSELRTLGIDTIEKLKILGWEKAFLKWVNHYPERLHTVVGYVVMGAVYDQPCFKLDPELKAEVKNFIKEFKSEFR